MSTKKNTSNAQTIIYSKNVIKYCAYLFIIWGLYRFLFRLPEDIEEFFIKPVLWLVPLYYILKSEKKGKESVGITTNNLFPAVYLSLILGMFFGIEGLLVNYIKYGSTFDFGAFIGEGPFWLTLLVTFATAISEEIAFRGYIFGRLWKILRSEYLANILSSVVWGIIHLPVVLVWYELPIASASGYLILTTIFGIGSAFIYARTNNIVSSILLHVMWSWPIILFR